MYMSCAHACLDVKATGLAAGGMHALHRHAAQLVGHRDTLQQAKQTLAPVKGHWDTAGNSICVPVHVDARKRKRREAAACMHVG
jgi:hypothetical protein